MSSLSVSTTRLGPIVLSPTMVTLESLKGSRRCWRAQCALHIIIEVMKFRIRTSPIGQLINPFEFIRARLPERSAGWQSGLSLIAGNYCK